MVWDPWKPGIPEIPEVQESWILKIPIPKFSGILNPRNLNPEIWDSRPILGSIPKNLNFFWIFWEFFKQLFWISYWEISKIKNVQYLKCSGITKQENWKNSGFFWKFEKKSEIFGKFLGIFWIYQKFGNPENSVIPNGNTEFPKIIFPDFLGIPNSQKISIPEL